MRDNTLHDDVQVLKEKIALLDGWRMGESERYDRLERDVGGIRDEQRGFRANMNDELRGLRNDMNERFVAVDSRFAVMDDRLLHIDAKIDEQGQHLGTRIDTQGQMLAARIDDSNHRISQILWLMLITMTGMVTNLVVLLLK